MAESRKRKTSEELLREAKEGLTGSYQDPALPSDAAEEPPPLIRPSDLIDRTSESGVRTSPESIIRDRPAPPTPPPAGRGRVAPSEARPRRVADSTLPPSSLPSELASPPSGTKPPLTGVGKLVRVFALGVIALMVFMWISLVVSIVQDPGEAASLLLGGAVMTGLLIFVVIALWAMSNRLRVDGEQVVSAFGDGTQPQGVAPTSGQERGMDTSGTSTSIGSHLEPGETVLAQATGVRPGSEGIRKLLSNKGVVGLIIAVALILAFAGGPWVLLIVGFVITRIVRQSKKGSESDDDPVIITLAVTNRRILAFSRKWWVSGPLTPWFSYPHAAVVSHSAVEKNDQPAIGMTFTDGRTTAVVVSKPDAIRVASALRTAGV